MPNPLSADIRARFEMLFAEGLTGREIGRRLMISAASASRLSQKLRQGLRLTPAWNPRNTGHGRLAPYATVRCTNNAYQLRGFENLLGGCFDRELLPNVWTGFRVT